MKAEPTIRSRSNPLLKRVGAVLAGKDRTAIVLEGDRLVGEALRAGLSLEVVLVAEDRAERIDELIGLGTVPARVVERKLLDRLSALDTSPGIFVLAAPPPRRELEELSPRDAPLVLVIAGVADPGNLGALARSAEAAGAGAVLVVCGGARAFGDKALRGSMGSLLRLPVYEGFTAAELAASLEAKAYRQVRAVTRGGVPTNGFDWSPPIALWVTGETGAMPDLAVRFEDVTIPMRGEVESLNVTVAGSLLLFAAGGGDE